MERVPVHLRGPAVGSAYQASTQHIQRNLDMATFRWDARYLTDGERTIRALRLADGMRLLLLGFIEGASSMSAKRTQLTLTLAGEDLSLRALTDSSRDFRKLLTEVGKSIAGRRVEWVVRRISHASPTRIELVVDDSALGDRIAEAVVEGLAALERSSARPQHFSDAAMTAAMNLSDRNKYNLEEVRVSSTRREFELNERIVASVKAARRVRYNEHGSVEGVLKMASIHGKPRLHLFDIVHGAQVECRAGRDEIANFGKFLGSRVVVEGELESDAQGVPLRIDIATLEPRLDDGQYPQLDQLIRLTPDLPLTTDQFNDYLREE